MEDFGGKIYVGVVEDNVDPKRLGRCKVRIPYTYDVIPLEKLPWASPFIEPNGKSFSIPPVGKIVNVTFDNGNIYMPYYKHCDKYNINLQDKLEGLSDEDYTNLIALIFDHRTRIYAEKEGLTLDYLVNKIKIDKSSINLELKNNDGRLNLGSAGATQSAVLGDHFIMDWFLEFVKILVKPTTLTGNYGSPVLKPELDIHLQKFLTNPKKYISKNVFIVDNRKVDKLQRDSITSEVEHDDTKFVTPSETISNGAGGINVEKTTRISKDAQKTIQDAQTSTKQELKDADSASSVTLAGELSNSTLADLNVPMVGIMMGMDLSQITMMDLINTDKINVNKDDLSKIKRTDLNIRLLLALGFSVIAIIGISILIINRIKAINKKAKRKRQVLSNPGSVNNANSGTTSTNDPVELQNESDITALEQEQMNTLTTNISADKALLSNLEASLSNQNYINTTSPEDIASIEDNVETLKTQIADEEKQLNDLIATSLTTTNPSLPNTTGGDTTNYNSMDQYSKKRRDMKRIMDTSKYTVDQRQREDVLNSTEAVTKKTSTIMYKDNRNYGRYYNSFNI